MSGVSIDAKCEKCGGGLNKGGIFPPGADPYNMCVGSKENVVYWYHALLRFLFSFDRNSENITYYHKECVPEDLVGFCPSQEDIEKFLEANKLGEIISVLLSADIASKTRLGPKK